MIRPVSLLIGNLHSGKYRILVKNTWVAAGGNQLTHPHLHLSTDNRHVIFNSDNYYGVPLVFVATVPDDFLPSLT